MRRLVSTALLATALLGIAACASTTDQNQTAATASSSPSAAASTAPKLDKAASCAAFNKDMEELKLKAIAVLGSLMKADKDPALAAKAVEDTRALFAEMTTSAEKHLATAADPELKTALTAYYEQLKLRKTAMESAGQDIDKLVDGMDDPAFEAAADKLDKLCA